MATLHALPVKTGSATPIPSTVQPGGQYAAEAEARVRLILSRLDRADR